MYIFFNCKLKKYKTCIYIQKQQTLNNLTRSLCVTDSISHSILKKLCKFIHYFAMMLEYICKLYLYSINTYKISKYNVTYL